MSATVSSNHHNIEKRKKVNMTQAQEQQKARDPDIVSIEGLTMYARLFEPQVFMRKDGTPDTPIWTTDILVDAKNKSVLQSKGVKIKNGNAKYYAFIDENGLRERGFDGSYIAVRKKTIRKKFDEATGSVVKDALGLPQFEAATRPPVRDARGNDIPDEAGLKIGNGSRVWITFGLTKPEFGGHGSYGARLMSTKICDLVEYKGAQQGTFVYGETPATPVMVATSAEDDFDGDELPF